jgi:hypothetical protein
MNGTITIQEMVVILEVEEVEVSITFRIVLKEAVVMATIVPLVVVMADTITETLTTIMTMLVVTAIKIMNPEEEAVEKTEEQAMEESEEDSVEETEKDGMEETEEEAMEDSEEETEEEAKEEEEDSMMIGQIRENKTKSLIGTIIRMMKLKRVRLHGWLGAIKMIRVIMKINRLQDRDGQHYQQRII